MSFSSLFSIFKKPTKFVLFTDPFGNYSLLIPDSWKFDSDVIVDDGKYSICFDSPTEDARLVVSLDLSFSPKKDFETYLIKKLSDPSSGSIGFISKGIFKDLKTTEKTFSFNKNGNFSGKVIAFKKGEIIYELTVHSKDSNSHSLSPIFATILSSIKFLR